MEQMEREGRRMMAAVTRDLDPVGFDPDGDLLGYVTGLQMTSPVAMVHPARDESETAVANPQAARIRVRMVTGDDAITGAAIAKRVGIGGEAILGADFAALTEDERLARIDDIGIAMGTGTEVAKNAGRMIAGLASSGSRPGHYRRGFGRTPALAPPSPAR